MTIAATLPRAAAPSDALHSRWPAILLVIAVAVLCALLLRALDPPAPRGAVVGYSATRALDVVRELAQAPRTLGSAAHDAARAAIVRRLGELGIAAEIQDTISSNEAMAQRWSGPTPIARVHNIVARLRGGQAHGAVLLMAHYDSVAGSPGAADDASGVAAVLEAARALAADTALPRDVILLFTDGEELGLLGARAFIAQHPWAREVGAVINVEARGRGGPALVFESTSQGAAILRRAARAWPEGSPRPLVGSLFFEVYQRLANDTDLTPWRERGVAAFNIAFVDGLTHYHSALDTPDNIDPASLQDQGGAVLGMARAALAVDPASTAAPSAGGDVVAFMSWPRHWHVVSRSAFDIAVTAAFALLQVGLGLAFVRRRIGMGAMVLGTLAALGIAVAAAVLAQAFWLALRAVVPMLAASPSGDVYDASWHALGLSLVAVGVGGALARAFVRRRGAFALWCGALNVWSGLLALLWFTAPGASYLPLAVLLPGSIALLAHVVLPRGASVFEGAAGVVALAAIVPLAALLFSGLGIIACAVPALLIGLVIPVLASFVAALDDAFGAWPWRASLAAGALAVVAVALATPLGRTTPRADNLLYVVDTDRGIARWATTDAHGDGWIARYVGADAAEEPAPALPGYLPTPPDRAPVIPRTLRYAAAPQAGLAAPSLAVEHTQATPDGRRVRLRVTPGGAATLLAIVAEAPDRVRAASVNGVAMRGDLPDRPWSARYWAPPAEGIVVELDIAGSAPLTLALSEQTQGLPRALLNTARPPESVALPYMGFLADASIVLRRVVID